MVFVDDIEKLTLENTDYRRVIYTADHSQLVLMSIPVGEDIELEIHNVDQFFRIEQGFGELQIFDKNKKRLYSIQDRTGMVVPSGTYHRIVNVGNVPLKLYSIYSPPQHPRDKVDKFRPENSKENVLKLFYLF